MMESENLWEWFGLSYASWLTIPRVLLHEMPKEWQDKLAELPDEYEETFPNQPQIGVRVQVTDLHGNLIKTPDWLINYRRPDISKITELKENK